MNPKAQIFLLKYIPAIFVLLCCSSGFGQLKNNGARIIFSNNPQIVLQDISFVNDGDFRQTTGTVKFTGAANNSVSGSSVAQFYTLNISKQGSAALSLSTSANVTNEIRFDGGLIDLNGSNIILVGNAILSGENESSRITGASGGYIETQATLNQPSEVNLGNLGAIITSSQNLGATTIRRGHQPQTGTGGASSIRRYYEIIPSNNNNLNATLEFHYFDSELNGLDENELVLWKNTGGSWMMQNADNRNTTTNLVQKNNINDFSIWALAAPMFVVPLQWGALSARCVNGQADIRWETLQESNTASFVVERSLDAAGWEQATVIPAAGNSSSPRSYGYTDHSGYKYFRIGQLDNDGKKTYSKILTIACEGKNSFMVYPNPVRDQLRISVYNDRDEKALLSVYSSAGQLIISRQLNLMKGTNIFSLDMKPYSAGQYLLHVKTGEKIRSEKVFKE